MLKSVTDETFHELVREVMEPVIVMFTGSWCGPCKQFLPTVEEYAKHEGSDITILTADMDQNERAASDFNIRTVPSLVLCQDGMIRDILTGTHSRNDIHLWVQDNI